MFEIAGAYATARCYASDIEPEAVEQVRRMCDSPVSEGSSVAIMPDAHAGVGCTIGTTMTIVDRVCPNLVGVDLGCGMYAVDMGDVDIDLARLDAVAHQIPTGFDTWPGDAAEFDYGTLRCRDELRNMGRVSRSLGTLGGGNHFIEVDRASDGHMWLVVHSGSRNLGAQVARIYQRRAVLQRNGGLERPRRRRELIARLRAEGRRRDIAGALERFDAENPRRGEVPDDLAYLMGAPMEDYLFDAAVCNRWARRNREAMASHILVRMGVEPRDAWHTTHNYIDPVSRMLRKGSISALEGERVVIPLNMRDGVVCARGRGVAEWNYSAPHGAGRAMSRRMARESLSMERFERDMRGIYTTCVDESTLDESPEAYKPADDIMDDIRASVDVVDVWKPVYSFKAVG